MLDISQYLMQLRPECRGMLFIGPLYIGPDSVSGRWTSSGDGFLRDRLQTIRHTYLLTRLTATRNDVIKSSIGDASYGALGHVPPPPIDFQLVILRTRTNFKRTNTENVQKQRVFAQFLSTFGPFFVIFCPQFSSGSNYSSQNAGTIANKFQLHMHFRFR